jgi:hypothetical protein
MTVKVKGSEFKADGTLSTDDTIEVVATKGGGIFMKIDEPWAGDTETGFGKECEITLDRETAHALRDFLNTVLG